MFQSTDKTDTNGEAEGRPVTDVRRTRWTRFDTLPEHAQLDGRSSSGCIVADQAPRDMERRRRNLQKRLSLCS